MTNLMDDQTLDQFLRPDRAERAQWTFRLGLELTQNPGLMDRIVAPDCSWDGLHGTVLSGLWHMLGPVKKTALAQAFLDKMAKTDVDPIDVIRGVSLVDRHLRTAWLNFVEDRVDVVADTRHVWLKTTMRPLLAEYLHSKNPDMMVEPIGSWMARYLEVAGRLGNVYRQYAVNAGMSDLIEHYSGTPIEDVERIRQTAIALVAGGAELNESRPEFYEQIDGIADEERIMHPDRVHETLFRWKRMGSDDRTNELARILTDLGGNWEPSWNDPRIGDAARQSLADCAAVRRAQLSAMAATGTTGLRKAAKM